MKAERRCKNAVFFLFGTGLLNELTCLIVFESNGIYRTADDGQRVEYESLRKN